jgi:ABC-type dipeptide/oligopeptide/nickel transport system permease component
MTRYIINRLIISIPVLLGVSLVAFFLVQASGDPMAVYNSNPNLSGSTNPYMYSTFYGWARRSPAIGDNLF